MGLGCHIVGPALAVLKADLQEEAPFSPKEKRETTGSCVPAYQREAPRGPEVSCSFMKHSLFVGSSCLPPSQHL